MDVYREVGGGRAGEATRLVMQAGRACDFFVLLLEGRVEVEIGREGHKFQAGPFTCYGEQMLEQALEAGGGAGGGAGGCSPTRGSTARAPALAWAPDYSLTITSPTALYLKVSAVILCSLIKETCKPFVWKKSLEL